MTGRMALVVVATLVALAFGRGSGGSGANDGGDAGVECYEGNLLIESIERLGYLDK